MSVAPHIALNNAQRAAQLARHARAKGLPTADIRAGEVTEARIIYAVAKIIADAPPLTHEGKARIAALIESAPELPQTA